MMRANLLAGAVLACLASSAAQAQQAPAPPARALFATAYDATRQRLVLFGGQSGTGVVNDTWEWDGERWSRAAADGPTGRAGHAMAFDAARGVVVLWGGVTAGQDLPAETWLWNGTAWTRRDGPGPPGRFGHQLVWMPARGRLALIGGRDAQGERSDVWEWDGERWSALAGQALSGPDTSGFGDVRLRAYWAAVRSDLRNLVTAQESYFADSVTYTTSLAALRFQASRGVTVRILSASARGWAAVATHESAPGMRCGIFVGNATPPLPEVQNEGEPACAGGPPRR